MIDKNEISKSIEFVGKCIEEIGYDAAYRNMTIVDGLVSVANAINRLAEAVEQLKNNSWQAKLDGVISGYTDGGKDG